MFVNKDSGQVLLTVVLVMIVALTVGLSLASRSIVEVRTSSEDADSQRALAAAEAGIEQALNEYVPFSGDFSQIPGLAYDVDITAVGGNELLLNNGNLVEKGDGVDIWFVAHLDPDNDGFFEPDFGTASWDENDTLDIYWGTSGTSCENAALEAIVIVGTLASPSLKRYALDPCDARRSSNNFINPDTGTFSILGETLHHKYRVGTPGWIAPGSTVLYAKVIPIYTNAIMGVDASRALPTQGYSITSTGELTIVESVKRSINVFRQYGQLPIEYVNYGLFSPCADVGNPDC